MSSSNFPHDLLTAAGCVVSKSFMDSLGHDGLNKMLDGFDDRSAEAVCTFAFCRGPGAEPILFQGRTKVSAVTEKCILQASV